MLILDNTNTIMTLAKALGKPILYVCYLDSSLPYPEWIDESKMLRACPFISALSQVVIEDQAIVVCDDENEMKFLYNLVYGGDGLTDEGREARKSYGVEMYEGEHRVYAMTTNANGEILTENR